MKYAINILLYDIKSDCERLSIKFTVSNVPFGDGLNPSPLGKEKVIIVAMRLYKLGAYTKTDLKAHLI